MGCRCRYTWVVALVCSLAQACSTRLDELSEAEPQRSDRDAGALDADGNDQDSSQDLESPDSGAGTTRFPEADDIDAVNDSGMLAVDVTDNADSDADADIPTNSDTAGSGNEPDAGDATNTGGGGTDGEGGMGGTAGSDNSASGGAGGQGLDRGGAGGTGGAGGDSPGSAGAGGTSNAGATNGGATNGGTASGGVGGSGGGSPAGGAGGVGALFFDDFGDGDADGWSADNAGAWAVATSGGSLALVQSTPSTNRTWSVMSGQSFTDLIVEARVKFNQDTAGDGYIFLAGRYQSQNNFYYMYLRANGKLRLRSFVNGSTTELGSAAYNTGAAIAVNQWNTIKLQIEGSTLSMYLNDISLDVVEDTALASGGIAMGADGTAASFDDVRVTLP